MNLLTRLIPAIILGLSVSPIESLQADQHGHVIYRDHDGNSSESEDDESDSDSDCDSDDYDSDSSDDECCHHQWAYKQKTIEPGYEEEDLTYEVDHDTSWPSKKENFSEMFR